LTDIKTRLISRLATITSFSVLLSFSGTSLALTQSAFGYNVSAAGDWTCNATASETVERMQLLDPELVLALGDLSYQSAPDCWFDIIAPLDSRMKIAIGNHDDVSSSLLSGYLDHFNLDHQYYSFNYENAHFLVLSTEQITSLDQLNFAINDLQAASSASWIDWIFVYMHKPMYTSPTNHASEPTMRDTYHPIFDQYHVDMVLNGHNHNYERSFPVTYDGDESPTVTTTERTNYVNPDGIIFATVGTAGASLYQWDGKAYFIEDQQDDYHGFLNIAISGTSLSAKYYSIRYNPDQLVVEDRFTITK
jgi:calcineurin-like phosphoesterase family protein